MVHLVVVSNHNQLMMTSSPMVTNYLKIQKQLMFQFFSAVLTSGIQAKQIVSLVDKRKDAVAFLSPARNTVLTSTDSPKTSRVAAANIVGYRKGENASPSGGDTDYTSSNLNVSSSYVVLDSGFKYMYDRFNDVFRYVPLNGDIAGIAVRSDVETETFLSCWFQ